jgi:hypothetical protein
MKELGLLLIGLTLLSGCDSVYNESQLIDPYEASGRRNLVQDHTDDLQNFGTAEAYKTDNNHVYFYTRLLDKADPETFEVMGNNASGSEIPENFYARDKTNVYYNDRAIEGADPNTFETLGNYGSDTKHRYARDENNVYYNDRRIREADPQSFRIREYEVCSSEKCRNATAEDQYRKYYLDTPLLQKDYLDDSENNLR